MGGLGIGIPTELAEQEFSNSVTMTKSLVQSIRGESELNTAETEAEQNEAQKLYT